MPDYRRILELDKEAVSQRGIADALGCSRNTISAAIKSAREKGIIWSEVADLDSSEIRRLLFPEPPKSTSLYTLPDFEKIHEELQHTGVSLMVTWTEYATKCREEKGTPYQYSFYCEQYRRWAQKTKATMHIVRIAGESIECDWAGDTMEVINQDGEFVCAYLFVAVLSYSGYCYVEAFGRMNLECWIDAHIHAFGFFDGCARLLIPDNLRTGVKKSDRYEPALNAAYEAMASHYGTTIIPARVGAPKDYLQTQVIFNPTHSPMVQAVTSA